MTNKYIKCTRDREALCSASEFRSDSNVRMAAIEKLDNKILNVCSIGDLPAREARYGKSCYRDYVRQQVYENQSVNKENRDNPFDTIDFNSAIKLACDFRRDFPLRGRLWSRNLGDKGRRWDQGSARPPAGATSLVPESGRERSEVGPEVGETSHRCDVSGPVVWEIKVGGGTRGRRDLLPGRRLWSRSLGDKGRRWDLGSARPPTVATSLILESGRPIKKVLG